MVGAFYKVMGDCERVFTVRAVYGFANKFIIELIAYAEVDKVFLNFSRYLKFGEWFTLSDV